MVVIFVDVEATAAELKGLKDAYQDALEAGFARASQAIADLFKDRWLSGRGSDDLGLNIRTGRLHDSIKSLTEVTPRGVRGVVFNTGAQYWEYHQLGTSTLPKRLFLLEAFQEDGTALYEAEAEKALASLAR